MYRVFCTVVMFCLAVSAHGRSYEVSYEPAEQSEDYNNVVLSEFEIAVGASLAGGYHGSGVGWRAVLAVESRLNIPRTPFTLGLDIYARGTVMRNVRSERMSYTTEYDAYSLSFDYNWRRRRNFSPFVGLCVGVADMEGTKSYDYDRRSERYSGVAPAVTPRAGVELLDNHLRLTLGYRFIRSEYHHMFLTAGWVIGGGVKKRKDIIR